MKKITSLLMMFMLFVGMGWAQMPKVSDETTTYLYYVLNVRDPYFVTTTKNEQVAQQLGTSETETDAKKNVIFKLKASGQNYKFYATNFGGKVVGYSDKSSGANKVQTKDNEENSEFTLTFRTNGSYTGFSICPISTSLSWNMFNGKGNNVGLWDHADEGGVWVFVPADEKTYNETVNDVKSLIGGAAKEIGKISPESQSYIALNTCASKSYTHENAIALAKAYAANVNVVKQSLYLPSGYYLMKNVDTSRKEYLYSDILRQDNDKYQTLQSERPSNVSNNYIWKVTNEGTAVKIVNGQGSMLRADNAGPFQTLHFGEPVSGKEGIYFTEALNCSNGGQNLNGTHCLTTWTTGGSGANDNRWNFETVSAANIYSVNITGLVEGVEDVCYLKKGEEVALNGGFIASETIPAQSDFILESKNGKYVIKSFEVIDHTINVELKTKAEVVQVVYEYFINNVSSGKTITVSQTVGEEYDAPVLKEAGDRNMAFVSYNCQQGVVEKDMAAVRVDVIEKLPFFVTTDEAHPVLYYMTINTTRGDANWSHCKRYFASSTGGFNSKGHFASSAFDQVQPTTLNGGKNDLWYVTGNSISGFEFHNMKEGKILTKENNQLVLKRQNEFEGHNFEHTWFLRYGQNKDGILNTGTGKEFGLTSTAGGNSINGTAFNWSGFDRGSSFIMYEAVLDIPMNVVGDKSYATLSLPYDFAVATENTQAFAATSAANHVLNCTEVASVPANAGVIVRNDAAAQKISVVIKPAQAIEGNLLKGNIDEIAFAQLSDKLVFGRSKGVLGFYKAGGSAPLGANKAYLPVSAIPAGVKAMVLSFGDGDITGIEGVEAEESVNAPIYDLSGRRVLNTVKGGIYIQNGKKFIVR